jgi:hypothetical protein
MKKGPLVYINNSLKHIEICWFLFNPRNPSRLYASGRYLDAKFSAKNCLKQENSHIFIPDKTLLLRLSSENKQSDAADFSGESCVCAYICLGLEKKKKTPGELLRRKFSIVKHQSD